MVPLRRDCFSIPRLGRPLIDLPHRASLNRSVSFFNRPCAKLKQMAPVSPGLCVSCKHAKTIPSDRGSKFVQCTLSKVDFRYPKYPRLPFLACPGWAEATLASGSPLEKC